jgi:hypothetical protein
MNILLFFVALVFGFIAGRVSYKKERLAIDKVDEDIAYYKKLTRDLVAENKSLRIEINSK